jgi:adenylylsulfate kinase
MVIWITGYSGAGKTTVAYALQKSFTSSGITSLVLDGDVVRDAMAGFEYGYDADSRKAGAYCYAKLALNFSQQGLVVIVSTVSLFHEVHAWNREKMLGYCEVFLDASEDVRRERDPKGLYKKHQSGELDSFSLSISEGEIPLMPDFHFKNNGEISDVELIVAKIVEYCFPVGGEVVDT